MSTEEYFATGPAIERPIFEAVLDHLESLGPVVVEPVSVGIFLKRAGTFVELRPKQRWVALSFKVAVPIQDPRIAGTMTTAGGRGYHVVRLRGPNEVDAQLCGWLTTSYFDAPK